MGTKLTEALEETKKTRFSFELLPPPKGQDVQSIYNIIDPLMAFDPMYINVTYHQEEVVYKKLDRNLVEKRIIWKRPGTVAISAAIKFKYKVTVIPHLICGGFTREETENALIDLSFLDIDNILALRGDPNREGRLFVPEDGGHAHAEDLVSQVMDMNKGIYLDQDLVEPMPTNFTVGVAGYPEKHPESPNLESDLHFLKRKISAGASFIVTQMFFDNQKFYDFEQRCRNAGITVPIIPGLKPITSRNQLTTLPKTFSIDLPEALVKEMIKCKKPGECYQLGIAWSIEQTRDLIKHGVPVVHYYTMGRADNIAAIAKASF